MRQTGERESALNNEVGQSIVINDRTAKHIGIVACSAEGAALCFREIAGYSSQFMGEHRHPQVTLSCIAMGEWMPAFDLGDYLSVAEFMLRETAIVANAGAEIAICPDNSAHL